MTHKQLTEESKDHWETPQYFFDLLDSEFHFTLDPCASRRNHKCEKYYTIDDNGLEKNWQGEIAFVNPPFSQKSEWIIKAFKESQKKDTTIVMILPSVTDTKEWHKYIMKADEVRFCERRVNFRLPPKELEKMIKKAKARGKKFSNSATFPLAIVIWRTPKINNILQISSFEHKSHINKGKSIYEQTKTHQKRILPLVDD